MIGRLANTFSASGPSLWWDDFAALRHSPAFEEKLGALQRPLRALICIGVMEQDMLKKAPPMGAMSLDETQALVAMRRMVDTAQD